MEIFLQYVVPPIAIVGLLVVAVVAVWAYLRVKSVTGTFQQRSQHLLKHTTGKSKADQGAATAIREQTELMRDYHDQGIEQCRISFLFSLGFAVLGFMVIVGALIAIFAQENRRTQDLVDQLTKQSDYLDRMMESNTKEDQALFTESLEISRELPTIRLEITQTAREQEANDLKLMDVKTQIAEAEAALTGIAANVTETGDGREERRLKREKDFQVILDSVAELTPERNEIAPKLKDLLDRHQRDLRRTWDSINLTLLGPVIRAQIENKGDGQSLVSPELQDRLHNLGLAIDGPALGEFDLPEDASIADVEAEWQRIDDLLKRTNDVLTDAFIFTRSRLVRQTLDSLQTEASAIEQSNIELRSKAAGNADREQEAASRQEQIRVDRNSLDEQRQRLRAEREQLIKDHSQILTQFRAETPAFWENSASVVGLLAGMIIDAVAGLFFVQSNRTRRLMREFFDRLRADEKLAGAKELVDSISDSDTQARLRSILALSFANVELKSEILNSVIKAD